MIQITVFVLYVFKMDYNCRRWMQFLLVCSHCINLENEPFPIQWQTHLRSDTDILQVIRNDKSSFRVNLHKYQFHFKEQNSEIFKTFTVVKRSPETTKWNTLFIWFGFFVLTIFNQEDFLCLSQSSIKPSIYLS